jgi:hypothetical protein
MGFRRPRQSVQVTWMRRLPASGKILVRTWFDIRPNRNRDLASSVYPLEFSGLKRQSD